MIFTQRGQTSVESVIALATLIPAICFILFSLMLIQNSMVVRNALYEATVCTQLYPQPTDCNAKARALIDHSILGSHLEEFSLHKDINQVEAVARLSTPLHKSWTISESIQTPLAGSKLYEK